MAEKNVKQADFDAAIKALTEAFDTKLLETIAKAKSETGETVAMLVKQETDGLVVLAVGKVKELLPGLVAEAVDAKLAVSLGELEDFTAQPLLGGEHMFQPDEEAFSDEEAALIDKACEAYGVDEGHILNCSIDRTTGEAVLVTHGGAKVRYRSGQEVEQLTRIQATGVNPDAKRKPIAGKAKN